MKVLLSPAKKLDFSPTDLKVSSSEPVFLEAADGLAKKLNKISSKKLKEMMHISDALAQLNKERYACWSNKETEKSKKQAILAFNGDVYLGLNATNWKSSELEYSQEKIRILSGLYGILKPLDAIKPYRLEMGSRWKLTASKTNLYKFWGTRIAEELEKEMTKDEVVLNLASSEYFKAVIPHLKKDRRVVSAEFKDFKNGEYKTIMVFAKKARGMMAKFVIKEKPKTTEDLVQFNMDGYQFDGNLSSENKIVFTR